MADDASKVRNLADHRAAEEAAGEQQEDKSLEQLEQEGIGQEDDGQMFVWEQGRKVTLSTLIARGTTVEHAFVFGGKRLKGTGGLMAWDDDVLLVVRGLPGDVRLVPTRNDDEKVIKVVVESHIAAKVIVPADSEQAMGMLAGVLEKRRPAAA